MSLLHFNYLRRKNLVFLTVILTLTSTLFSVTAYSFLGFYNGFTSYVGSGKDVVAVYSNLGSTPFTGTIPISLTRQINSLNGVIATSPEVIAPTTINGQAVFIRGILPQSLPQLDPIVVVKGEDLKLTDTNRAIVGRTLAQRLNLKVGDQLLVFSVFSERYVQLVVKGVFQSESSLNDEALVPIYVGQWLRGLNYDYVTLVRAKIDPAQTSINQINQQLANQTRSIQTSASPTPPPQTEAQRELEALLPIAESQPNFNLSSLGVEPSQDFMQNYLNRYGISKDTLLVLSVVVLVFASATAVCAVTLFVKQHGTDIETLEALGLSSKKIKLDLLARMIPLSLIATLIGTLVSALVLVCFESAGYLQVLSHTLSFQLDPLIAAANFGLLSVLMAVNIARMELKP